MQRLEQAHHKIHDIAYVIQCKYQAGNLVAARADLTELELAYDELINATAL